MRTQPQITPNALSYQLFPRGAKHPVRQGATQHTPSASAPPCAAMRLSRLFPQARRAHRCQTQRPPGRRAQAHRRARARRAGASTLRRPAPGSPASPATLRRRTAIDPGALLLWHEPHAELQAIGPNPVLQVLEPPQFDMLCAKTSTASAPCRAADNNSLFLSSHHRLTSSAPGRSVVAFQKLLALTRSEAGHSTPFLINHLLTDKRWAGCAHGRARARPAPAQSAPRQPAQRRAAAARPPAPAAAPISPHPPRQTPAPARAEQLKVRPGTRARMPPCTAIWPGHFVTRGRPICPASGACNLQAHAHRFMPAACPAKQPGAYAEGTWNTPRAGPFGRLRSARRGRLGASSAPGSPA